MVDTVAVVSVVASSTVALVSVGAQVWLSRISRENERRDWLRDRRTDAYLALLELMRTYAGDVTREEWVTMSARINAFASRTISTLYSEWRDVSERGLAASASEQVRTTAAAGQDEIARKIELAVAAELQGKR
jgi:hypothetical protein